MIDISTQVVSKLNSLLPTYYDLFLDSSSDVPCISYQQIENSEVSTANINGYSRITFRIKLWCRTVEDVVSYSAQIDNKMAELGEFERRSTAELADSGLVCRILDYSILMNETYSTQRN